MSVTQTAISINEGVFLQVIQLTRKLRISLSQFFTQAARYMIQKDRNLDLLKRINASYSGLEEAETARLADEKKYTHKKIVEKW